MKVLPEEVSEYGPGRALFLAALRAHGGWMTYGELEEATGMGFYTLRRHRQSLEPKGVVEHQVLGVGGIEIRLRSA